MPMDTSADEKFQLYTDAHTGGFAPHAVLQEAGAEFDLHKINIKQGEAQTAHFRKLNPRAEVPVLVLPDGSIMTESSAMTLYLADLLSPGDLAPTIDASERPAYLRWISFIVANIYASARRYYYPERHTTDASGIDAVRTSALDYMNRQLSIIDEAIADQPFLLKHGYSAADIYLTMLVCWHPDRITMEQQNRNIRRVCEAVQARPALQEINKFHQMW